MSAKVSSLSVIVRMPVCERVHMSGKNVRLRWLLHKGLFSPWAASSSVKNTEQALLCKLKNTKGEHFYFTELCTATRHWEGHKQ